MFLFIHFISSVLITSLKNEELKRVIGLLKMIHQSSRNFGGFENRVV